MARARAATPAASEEEQLLDELEADEVVPAELSQRDIEEKYDKGQARIVIQRNDFLVPNLLEMLKTKEVMDITPNYQRRSRWSNTKRSHLIESLLMNVPIPPIFLYEREYAKYEVMDGQQRLTAIRTFRDNQFKLQDLKIWPELNGKDFHDLPLKIQKGLERRSIAAVIILTESSTDASESLTLRQYVFERLNTGGERLNPQEIRNCLYASHFNDMLIDIARSDLFTQVWNIPQKESGEPNIVSRKLEKNSLYSTMGDCVIALRYFLLSDMSQFKGGMKKSLDDCMITKKPCTKEECDAMQAEYSAVLQLAKDIYDDSLFRLPIRPGTKAGRKSVPFSDAILLAIKSHIDNSGRMLACRDRIVANTVAQFNNPDRHGILVGTGNTKASIEARIDVMKQVIADSIA